MRKKHFKVRNNEKYIAVIGDVHGCFQTFRMLYQKIRNQVNNVYCTGDIIDRGPNTKDTVQFLIDNNLKSVIGNHEYWFLQAMEHIQNPDMFRKWLLYGGDTTIDSYMEVTDATTLRDIYDMVVSLGHIHYIASFPFELEINNIILTHAGKVKDGNKISQILNSEKPLKIDGKLQVFGHTPYQEIQYIKEWYAGIDTGCVFKNKLTAVVLDTVKAEIVDVIKQRYIE